MNDGQIRRLNKYQAERAFMTDNAADFPTASPGRRTSAALGEQLERITALAAEQNTGAVRRSVALKGDLLDDLIKLMRKMNRAANSLADEVDGIEDLFRMPRRRSEEAMIAAARAFYNDSEPYASEFQEYDLPAAFRAELLALINSYEDAANATDTAELERGGATGGLAEAFRAAGRLSRKLKGIVENKYADDPQKLAAWLIASHLEAAPKEGEEPVTA